jgi:hypothetical protein
MSYANINTMTNNNGFGGASNKTMIEDLPRLEEISGDPYMQGNLPPDMINTVSRHIRTKHPGMERQDYAVPIQEHYALPQNKQQASHGVDPFSFSCLDVANHVKDCPICSKFYNTDKSMYVVIILLLTIICVILLKKLLNL